ncbi:histidine--tRNA ligase [Methanococcoides sp. SA1]|nr:histidine--tRNA ligase [Methanococcoides sp. SA1]
MSSRTVKGFNEYVGVEAARRAAVRKVILRDFESYGFEPIESPTIEFEDFVKKDAGEDTISEIFRLEDRGKRKLALKYESTFQLKRLARNQKLPFKRYTITQVFRDEPIGTGRFREFTQCDCDVVGSGLKDEAEVLSLVAKVLGELGIKNKIYVNNRKLLNEIMVDLDVVERDREDVIRVIDKLDKLPKKKVADELKKFGAEKVLDVVCGSDFSRYKFYGEVEELIKYCKMFGVEVEFQATLARGLAYYNGTVFEVKADGLKGTVCGGGAYLVDQVQAFGFAFGLDRICMLSDIEGTGVEFMVLSLDEDEAAIEVASKLRENGRRVLLLMDKSIGKGLEYANAKGVGKVVFVGAEEVKSGKFKVKEMGSGEEEFFSMEKILSF